MSDAEDVNIWIGKADDSKSVVFWALGRSSIPPPKRLPLVNDHPEHPGLAGHFTVAESRRAQWSYLFQPWLGYVPKFDPFVGPIWGRFGGSRSTLSESISQTTDGRYIFDTRLAVRWLRVEGAVSAIVSTLYNPLVPLDARRPPRPSDTKFYEPKSTQKRALDSVMFAQKLFLYLTAEFAHAVRMSRSSTLDTWIDKVKKAHPGRFDNDDSWLKDLDMSVALRGTPLCSERAGYLVHPDRILNPRHALLYAEDSMPVYMALADLMRTDDGDHDLALVHDQANIERHLRLFPPIDKAFLLQRLEAEAKKSGAMSFSVWGEILPVVRYPQLPYFMAETAVDESHADYEYIEHQGDDDDDDDCLHHQPHPNDLIESPLSPIPMPPAPLPGTRQQQGQTIEDFFQELECIRGMDGSDAEQAEKALAAFRDGIGGRKAFVWLLTPLHDTHLIRTPISGADVAFYWGACPPERRYYDPLFDEWDLCPLELEDSEPTAADVDLQTSDSPEPEDHHLAEDLKESVDASVVSVAPPPLFCSDDAKEYAMRYFGFLFPSPPILPYNEPRIRWGRALGFSISNAANLDYDLQMRDILRALEEKGDVTGLLDLVSCPNLLLDARRAATIRIVSAEIYDPLPSTYPLYLFRFSPEDDAEWVVAVKRATHVVLALREQWLGCRDTLVEKFATYGVPFFTLRPSYGLDTSRPLSLTDKINTIPMAEADGKYTLTHYQQYQQRRELLLDSALGRVAGRSGGIVARLWRKDTGKFKARLREINAGPTEYAAWYGIRVECGEEGSFYDDKLTPNVEGVICGVYCAQLIGGKYDDRTRVSWYPTQKEHHCRRDADISRWTAIDERSFKRFEDNVIVAETGPRCAKSWKKASDNGGNTLDVAYDAHCVRFLLLNRSHL